MTLLIVIDMQNDFVTGALGTAEAQADRAACECEDRSGGCPVVYTLDTHGEDYLATQEGKRLPCRTASAAPGAMRWPTA